MEYDSRENRIISELIHFKNEFESEINHKIISKDKIIITDKNFQCIILTDDDWPFIQPQISLIYDKCITIDIRIPGWSSFIELKDIYAYVYDKFHEIIRQPQKICEINENSLLSKIEHSPEKVVKKQRVDNRILSSEPKVNKTGDIIHIEYDTLNITINTNRRKIEILEDKRNWPLSMTSKINLNSLEDIIPQIVNLKKQYPLKNNDDCINKYFKSLVAKFENVSYTKHNTFIVSTETLLIIIGFNKKVQYLPPTITIFKDGSIVSCLFKFDDWNQDSDLGEIILFSIKHIQA